ncbi:MAG: CBS domain-containing protein [Pseudomonadota bacterium]|nr:CBS domain-containing protein [Pseudomonadota bacterium]
MTAELFMNPNPAVLRTDDTIAKGAQQIMAKQRRSVPVVDEDGRFRGMLTANCLLYLCLPKAATMAGGLDSMAYVEDSLEDVAERLKQYLDEPLTRCLKTEKVAVVHPDTPIVETLLTLYQAKANLPVVEKNTGMLVGMISYYNVGAKIMAAVNAKTE